MKKTSIAILAILYIVVTSGVVVNVHYCMGKLASVDYGFSHSNTCHTCGMENKKGCCHTDFKVVKLQDVHQVAKVTPASPHPPEGGAVLTGFIASASLYTATIPGTPTYHPPPNLRDNSVYLYNNVFRI